MPIKVAIWIYYPQSLTVTIPRAIVLVTRPKLSVPIPNAL